MREIKVAMSMIVDVDEYLLQFRDEETENGATGLIGCFGGQIEDSDSDSYEAVSRELSEEIQIGDQPGSVVPPSEFRRLGSVHVESDRDGQPAFIKAEVFEILLPHGIHTAALRGQLRRIMEDDISENKALGKLTPATSAAFGKFYGI